jgi:phosphoglycolate phosphatase-like HAD superfamily hydrolase
MRALALDFDGVISDSASEAYVVSLRTCLDLEPESSLADELARIEGDGLGREGVRALPRFGDFVALMPLGNRAEDYAVIWSILQRGVEVADQAGFDRQRRSVPSDFLAAYHRRFYQVRHQMAAEDPEGWHRLMGPYPEFVSLLRRRASEVTMVIVTAKDGRSVSLLLKQYGIGELFPPGRVLDKEVGSTKVVHLKHLQQLLHVASTDITFIDDKVSHLDAVWHLGVRCALASWGYNGPREHRQARKRGYDVCTLEDVERQLFD